MLRTFVSTFRRHYSVKAGKKTPLHDLHVDLGGKMVEFAGWALPVQYESLGIAASHLHTRSQASIFDVSHMLQTNVTGKNAVEFMESLTVADLKKMPLNSAQLSLFTNPTGGIIDDTIIAKHEKSLHIVSNAGCAEKVLPYLQQKAKEYRGKGKEVTIKPVLDGALIAIQGPKAAHALELLTKSSLKNFYFMTGTEMMIKGISCYVTRCGYTGEDGFEIAVKGVHSEDLCRHLLSIKGVEMAGLGARDSLRLEAGLCLYGHDINETTTPSDAGLNWTIGKRRRVEGGFPGQNTILQQLADKKSPKRRIGFIVEGAPARERAEIYTLEKELIGSVTSGVPSPSLKQNIGMGYVNFGHHKLNTPLLIRVRNKFQHAKVVKMPFVSHQYYLAPKE